MRRFITIPRVTWANPLSHLTQGEYVRILSCLVVPFFLLDITIQSTSSTYIVFRVHSVRYMTGTLFRRIWGWFGSIDTAYRNCRNPHRSRKANNQDIGQSFRWVKQYGNHNNWSHSFTLNRRRFLVYLYRPLSWHLFTIHSTSTRYTYLGTYRLNPWPSRTFCVSSHTVSTAKVFPCC